MAKPTTLYTQSTTDSAASKWTLNSTLITLASTTAYLNGYFTAIVPDQADNKFSTAFTNVAKATTVFITNSLLSTGVQANSTTVQANSTTVPATGYASGVPSYDSSRIPTAWSPA